MKSIGLTLYLICVASVLAQSVDFRAQAKEVYKREFASNQRSGCGNILSMAQTGTCLARELDVTKANYRAFTSALRSLLSNSGTDPKTLPPGIRETDRPLTAKELADEFDAIEKASTEYQDLVCQAASNQYKGGKLAWSNEASCRSLVVRNHMHELFAVYRELLQ